MRLRSAIGSSSRGEAATVTADVHGGIWVELYSACDVGGMMGNEFIVHQ